MTNRVYKFFDKFEDTVRGFLSHYPIIYAIIGGTGTVLVWRGVWHTADFLSARYFHPANVSLSAEPTNVVAWGVEGMPGTIDYPFLWDGAVSLILGTIILLATGLLVSNFIGEHVILSGLKREKKVTEKTEEELKEEASVLVGVLDELKKIESRLEALEKKANGKQ